MHNQGENSERNRDVTFDKTDLSPRGVFGFLIGLAVAGLVIHFVLWGTYKYLAKTEVRPTLASPMETSNRPQPGKDPAQLFPTPRLQPDPTTDLDTFRIHEEQLLNSYGWTDEKAGVMRIPIDRAIDLTAERGLPTRPPQPANAGAAGGPQ